MKKRIAALALITGLCVGSLSGCGSASYSGKAENREVTESTQADEAAVGGYEAAGYDTAGYDTADTEQETDGGYFFEETYEAEEEGYAGREEQSYLESCYDYDFRRTYGSDEEYSKWEEKGFSSVKKEPFSTFSADVDTASYSNLRRLIREGYTLEELPEGSVRIEEMLNYFSYDLKEPEKSEPFGVTTQISSCPWNEEAQLLMIGLKTKEADYEELPPSNLVFLLDVSGSMYASDKLPLLQEAFCLLSENLTEKDRVSIVTYAGEDTVVLNGVSGDKTRKIQKALMGLEAGGGTHGSKGIETAYAIAEENFIKGGNNRIILATDGDLNIGLTSQEELEDLITEKKESGIFLSVLGFGSGNIKDNKMETLADKGNGNYAYIDSLREANKVLVEEMSATLLTICKDVKLQVEFNPAVVSEYRLIGYENRALDKEDFEDDTKDAGEIGAGHSVTALYELILKDSLWTEDIEDLKGTAAEEEEWLILNIRYKKPAEEESRLLQYPAGFESCTGKPSEDFRFAAAVAEFGLLASHSEFQGDASLRSVKKTLRAIDLDDEYKEEFLELVEGLDF